jgi:hypothetical protein
VLSLSRSALCTTIFLLIVISWDILYGQTVPGGVGEGGTVPNRISVLFNPDGGQVLDSLDIRMLEIDIAKARARVEETNFISRIIPQIHISASFGLHDIIFLDPSTFNPYILPKDAYRLTLSLSLNEIISSCAHTQALHDLDRLEIDRARLGLRRLQTRKALEHQFRALLDNQKLLEKELSLTQDLLRFNELRFQQGKIEFDAIVRTKLELLGILRSIHQLELRQSELRLKDYEQ